MSPFEGFEHIVREREPLAPLTWFRLGGAAEYFAEPTTEEQLAALLGQCHEAGLPVRVLGAGSRVLVREAGVEGLVIHLSTPEFCGIEVHGNEIRAGGGAKLGHLVSTAVGSSLAGLESLVGIPGTVAGALRGNAATPSASIGQWATEATLLTRVGEKVTRDREAMRFSHGESNLDELVIVNARFALEPGDASKLTRTMQKAWIVKRSKQPSENMGVGRVFRDAQGMSAEELLDQAGCRGMSHGAARVADVSANFVVAESGATSEDVVRLTEQMRDRVASSLGITLEYELEIW